MPYFHLYDKQKILRHTRIRRYETKLGEKIGVLNHPADWKLALVQHPASFVLLGIPEDIGVKANGGTGGTHTAWESFLTAFLNIQSTDVFQGSNILLLGAFDFGEVDTTVERNAPDPEEKLEAWRHAVANVVDDAVEDVIKAITTAGKIPLVVGGGHNNCYPLLKGAAKGWFRAGKLTESHLNAINLDAHADFRLAEGRHSGNGFRYALEENYLHRYAIVGLHEHYNSQSMLDDLISQPDRIQYSTYEDIFLRRLLGLAPAVQQAIDFTSTGLTGIELDLDCIAGVLSSAITPCGITPLHARQYLHECAKEVDVAYLHICEGAVELDNGRQDAGTGKLIAYLVADFVKAFID